MSNGKSQVTRLPDPLISYSDEPISDSGPWHQWLVYNIDNDEFLCWTKLDDDDNRLAWYNVDETKGETLVVMEEKNIHEFELRKGNKTDFLTDVGIEIYHYLCNSGWAVVIFIPLLCWNRQYGQTDGLLKKLDFVHGFTI